MFVCLYLDESPTRSIAPALPVHLFVLAVECFAVWGVTKQGHDHLTLHAICAYRKPRLLAQGKELANILIIQYRLGGRQVERVQMRVHSINHAMLLVVKFFRDYKIWQI
jgi:hypothetical protein